MTAYTTVPWPTLCEEWSKLKIGVPDGALISFAHFNPSAETVRARKRWQKMVTPSGRSPATTASQHDRGDDGQHVDTCEDARHS